MAAVVGQIGRPLINWAYLGLLFTRISPYYWCAMGIALCVGLSILGAAWCAGSVPGHCFHAVSC